MRNVLLLAAARSGWRSPVPVRQGRGIAAHHTALTHTAAVARVSVADDGRVGVRRIDLAVDCGLVTDAERVAETLRDAALTALSSTLHRNPRFERPADKDQVSESASVPDIRVHIVRSAESPGGRGDTAVPTVMAALVNAIFAATGKRAWSLPVDPALLRLH
jgi:isoquinoline 1-oxidoreductase subunit beta